MALPSNYPEWATVTRYDPLTGFINKLEPLEQFKDSGLIPSNNPDIPNEMLGANYLDYQFNLIYKWIVHLAERSQQDDVIFFESTGYASTLDTLFGGTWEELGSETIAGSARYVYRRTTA